MSNRVHIYDDVYFDIPEMPDKKSISGYELPQKDQRWKRMELPEEFIGLTPDELNDFCDKNAWAWEFIQEEERKCSIGHWFYNNGTPTYITGDNYFYLNWFKLNVGYPSYFDKDKRWFYFAKCCDDNPNCFGMLYAKKRRDGFSYRAMSRILNDARRTFNSNYGMMSKTGDDAKGLFEKFVYGFQEMPIFFKPQVQSAEDVKKEMVLKEPTQRVTHKTKSVKRGISLNNKINYKNTKENSYDGDNLKKIVGDEVAKMEEADFEKWLSIVKTCLTKGANLTGKGDFGSTVNEAKKGGNKFNAVWKNSNSLEKNANGRTTSGLWKYLIPGYDGYEGYIDEYGMSVIDDPLSPVLGIDGNIITRGAKTFLLEELQSKKDKGDIVGYYETLRQFPFTEEDLFREPADEQVPFDVEKIYQQLDYNAGLTKNHLRRGNFGWKDGRRDTEVVFNDDENGRWLVYWMPPIADRNKSIIKYGQKGPANTHEGVFSVDPVDHKYTSSNKKSKAASHGFRKLSLIDAHNSDIFVTQYWGRPTEPYDLYEDMLMQCVFYGWAILGESNKPGCMNYFRDRGYGEYLMDRPAFTHSEYSEKNQKEKWIPNVGDVEKGIRRMLIEHYQSYVYQKVGINNKTGLMGCMMFDDTLKDNAKFDIENWTDYDLTVSAMYCVIGSKAYVPKKVEHVPIQFFKKYDNRGNESKEIK